MDKQERHDNEEARQLAHQWLLAAGIEPVKLSRLSGFSNQVYLVSTAAATRHSVLRLANKKAGSFISPLSQHAASLIQIHRDAAQLGLAPPMLGSDSNLGLMWLAYAGEPRIITQADWPDIQLLIESLQGSALNWQSGSIDPVGIGLIQQCVADVDSPLRSNIDLLLSRAVERGYEQLATVPVHSDLNPDNCLHDGQRWWFIDWDFAGMRVPEWEYAAMIVEHGWDLRIIDHWSHYTRGELLKWLCAALSIISWCWHVRRGSSPPLIRKSKQYADFWLRQIFHP